MKKILFTMAMLPLFAFVGCSSDDDEKTPGNDFDYSIELLYGKWTATSIDADGDVIDLTDPVMEMIVEQTTVTFEKDGDYSSTGLIGEGTGKYIAKDKTITTSIKDDETISFKVKSLEAKTALVEIKVEDIDFGDLKMSEEIETVIVELTKDYTPEVGFDHDIELLYGKWRATSVEGVGEEAIDLTNPVMEEIVPPTYVTFEEEGVYKSEGILGEGTGLYGTKGKKISTFLDDELISFDMTELTTETARIELNAEALGLPMIPEGIETVTVVLTKQAEE